jgi:hypothetical protein
LELTTNKNIYKNLGLFTEFFAKLWNYFWFLEGIGDDLILSGLKKRWVPPFHLRINFNRIFHLGCPRLIPLVASQLPKSGSCVQGVFFYGHFS